MTVPRFTYDGLPIAPDEPHGAAIVTRRPAAGPSPASEYLILHRAHRGPDYEGDWAWTPPSGSRLPGEPVLAAALRELAEEAGFKPAAAQLRVLDLSGPWARFLLDLPAGAQARIDPEHDRLEWVPAASARARCQPAAVTAGITRAEAVFAAPVEFRPLTLADLPALLAWQQAPHSARWFPERLSLAAAQDKYGPRIGGDSPTRVHVALVGGEEAGFLQHYLVGDYPDYAAVTGRPDAVGIDYAIGIESLTGRGLGPQLIWSYLRDVALPSHPAAREVLASPDVANLRSVRALDKAGFIPAEQLIDTGSGPERLCVLDVARFFGLPAAIRA